MLFTRPAVYILAIAFGCAEVSSSWCRFGMKGDIPNGKALCEFSAGMRGTSKKPIPNGDSEFLVELDDDKDQRPQGIIKRKKRNNNPGRR